MYIIVRFITYKQYEHNLGRSKTHFSYKTYLMEIPQHINSSALKIEFLQCT